MILRRRKLITAALIVAIGSGTWWMLDANSVFGPSYLHRPKVDPTPPLKPNTLTSTIKIPVMIDLAEIRSALDAAAPRSFVGKRENPIFGLFGRSEIGWVIRRELLALVGQPDGLKVSTGLSGDILVGETLTGSRFAGAQRQFGRDVHSGKCGLKPFVREAVAIDGRQ